jgi:DNA-binding NtrC family response regulator
MLPAVVTLASDCGRDVMDALRAAGLPVQDSPREPLGAIPHLTGEQERQETPGQDHDTVVIVDLDCDNALDRLRALRRTTSGVIVPTGVLILAVASPSRPDLTAAVAAEDLAHDVLPRPLAPGDIVAAIERAHAAARCPVPAPAGTEGLVVEDTADTAAHETRLAQETPLAQATHLLPQDAIVPCGIIGRSAAMRAVLAQIREAAATRDGVLISGEPGTGRGLVARVIHAARRPAGEAAPFIPVYCQALSPAKAEAELFGTPPGGRPARLAASPYERLYRSSILLGAAGGTVYFRHPEELPARAQLRLARLFRDRECLMGSAADPVVFDARPVAAVDTAFQTSVRDGRLRPEFYRRLASHHIRLPALRDRREDLPQLVQHFLLHACRKAGVPPKTIEEAAVSVMAAMPWPGNARELQGLLDQLALRTRGDVITLTALLDFVRFDRAHAAALGPGVPIPLREARARFEREYIQAVLAHYRGRIPDAAQALGIQRTNLYRKIRALNLGRPHPVQ